MAQNKSKSKAGQRKASSEQVGIEDNPEPFTTHYEPPNGTPEVDIIAIGNGEKSIWEENTACHSDDEDDRSIISQKEKQARKAVNWMKDPRMLPSTVPNSRIMEFCYSQQDASIQNLRYLTERFLRCYLKRRGASKSSGDLQPVRPVIFIAYGHGGVVLELAIMISYNSQLTTSSLSPSTKTAEVPKSSKLRSAKANALNDPTISSSNAVTPSNPVKDQASVPHDQFPSSVSTTEILKAQPAPLETELADAINTDRGKSSSRSDGKVKRLSNMPSSDRELKERAHHKVDNRENSKPSHSLDLRVVAGILLLGSPLEVPAFVSARGTDIWKPEHLADEKSEKDLTLKNLLDACVKTMAFRRTIKMEYPGHTIYHDCFERTVNEVAVPTKWYQGSNKLLLEGGNYFLKEESVNKFVSLQVAALSNPGIRPDVPLNRYSGPADTMYMKLRARVRSFLQEYIFFRAVRNAANDDLKRILEQNRIDPNKPRFRGKTALHMATEQGEEEIVTTLINGYADLSIKTDDGKTPLYLAVENLDLQMVEFLLKKGARSDSRYNNGKDLRRLLSNSVTEAEKAKKIVDLLDDPPLVDGPGPRKTLSHERPRQGSDQDWPQPAPQPDGEKACKYFQITIGNFFVTSAYQEKFDIKSATVHDVLYNEGPKRICEKVLSKAELTEKGLGNSHFTWYHVPANNIDWVEGIFLRLGMQNLLPLDMKEYRGMKPWSSKIIPSVQEATDEKPLSLFLPFLNVETSNNRKHMSEVIQQVEVDQVKRARKKDWNRYISWDWFSQDDDFDEELEDSPDAWLIRGYMKDSKGLHVRRTLDQSHYPMLPSTEERDVDQILLKRGKLILKEIGLNRPEKPSDIRDFRRPPNERYSTTMKGKLDMLFQHRDEEFRVKEFRDGSRLKVVMVDQLWLWMFEDMGQRRNESKDYDFLAKLLKYIRDPRRNPFSSVRDLAVTIVQRCSTIFITDSKLLLPLPHLLEVYQEAIGDVSDKEAAFFRKFNKNLIHLSMLYKRVQNEDKKTKRDTELKFRKFLWDKYSEIHEDQETDSSDTDERALPIRYRYMRRRPISNLDQLEMQWRVTSEMIEDPEKKISKLLDSFNDITKETSQLIEIKDIIDELKMICEVQDDQMKVLEGFKTALITFPSLFEDMKQFVENGKHRCAEITALSGKAKETLEAIEQLLELKQKQANASEARTTRMQAEQSEKQGKTLMVFTIVTIIFLPLSFMTAFFAVPISDWPKNQDGTSALNLRYVSKFIFPLSIAMILPLLILAFTINGMRDKLDTLSRKLDVRLVDVDSSWKRAYIRIMLLTSPARYHVTRGVATSWKFFYWVVWNKWIYAWADWVKDGASELVEKMGSWSWPSFSWPWKKKDDAVSNNSDPESQEA